MDVSNREPKLAKTESEEPAGQQLLDTLVSLTGLPENLVHNELSEILKPSEASAEEITLDQLRKAMVAYLETFKPQDFEEETDEEVTTHAPAPF